MRYTQPVLPPDVNQFYIPVAPNSGKPGQELEYQPWVLGFAKIVFLINQRTGREHTVNERLLAKPPIAGHPIDWDKAIPFGIDPVARPEPRATWTAAPEALDTGRKVKALEKAFIEPLYSTQKLLLHENRDLEMVSAAGETLDAFRRRCRQQAELESRQAQDLEKVKAAPEDRGGGAIDEQGPRGPHRQAEGGPASEAGRIGGEAPQDRRDGDRIAGEAAEGGYTGDALRAGVGAVLDGGEGRVKRMPYRLSTRRLVVTMQRHSRAGSTWPHCLSGCKG